MLLRSLPAEARLARLPGDEVVWSTNTELLARLVEEISILSSDRRRKKPLEIPRPGTLIRAADEKVAHRTRGVKGLEQLASEMGRVRET